MNKSMIKILMGTLLVLFSSVSQAATTQEKRMNDATDVLDQILRIPEQAVPPALLSRAYAIAVFPEEESIIVLFFVNFFLLIPSKIIERAALSLIEPPGLNHSAFIYMFLSDDNSEK